MFSRMLLFGLLIAGLIAASPLTVADSADASYSCVIPDDDDPETLAEFALCPVFWTADCAEQLAETGACRL